MNIEEIYQLFEQYPVVSTDTRNIAPNSIFVALKGETFNGNKFALDALKKGAKYAVIDEIVEGSDERMIKVDNSLECLQQLARYHRRKLNIPVLAITGTNGKTTTKELTAAVLSKKYHIANTKGNLNNHIGVPLTLLTMNSLTEMAVIEMGANHPGEIEHLCKIAEPDFGIITNVGKAHLEGFGSFEGVVQTKTEMYNFLKETGGKCFVNANDEILIEKSDKLERETYGNSRLANLQGEEMYSSYFVTAKVLFKKGWLFLKSNLIGSYNFDNIMAAACIGNYFGVDPIKIQEAIVNYKPTNNRSQLIEKGSNRIIMDAYNANPTSMMAALKNIISINHPLKTVILGDMLELGNDSEVEHQRIADFLVDAGFDHVYFVGENFSNVSIGTKEKKFDNAELLTNYLIKQPLKNNLILIKGSRGISLEKVLEAF